MMDIILYLVAGLAIGGIIGWLLGKSSERTVWTTKTERLSQLYNELEKEFVKYRANHDAQLSNTQLQLREKCEELLTVQQSAKEAQLQVAESTTLLATAKADLRATNQLLATQKEEITALNKKFNLEFEIIANRILENKTEKFTELNKANLNLILQPLGKQITEFKTKVEDVYQKESEQRFSLGERVKELAELNRKISEEANNLTRALKSESKTQGGWGEMILESILERSGLVKNREYFMEHQLHDEQGNPLRSDAGEKKMRPDAVIKYPDNRHVIIDSKVSLNAFTRSFDATDEPARLNELNEHVACVRRHVQTLSAKGYDV